MSFFTVLGTVLAAIIAGGSAIYTATQGRRAQVVSAEKTAESQDREGQREAQVDLLKMLSNEVEVLNKRVTELRLRLTTTEDFADMERTKRRDVEVRLEELSNIVERLRDILASLPEAKSNPELRRLLKSLEPPTPRQPA